MSDLDSETAEDGDGTLPDAPTSDDEGSFTHPERSSGQEDPDQGDDETPVNADVPPGEREVPWSHETEPDDDDEPSAMEQVMDDLKDAGVAEDVDEEQVIADATGVKESDEEDPADFVKEWQDRMEAAESDGDDENGSSAESSSGSDNTEDDDELEDPYEFDEEPVTGDELGLVDDDLDLSGLQENEEVTLPTRGYDITYADPEDDDAITNQLRDSSGADDASTQRKAAAQLAVKAINGHERPVEGSDKCLTDDLWESFSPPVRIEIGIKSMAMMGFLASLDGLGDGRARQRDVKSVE